MAERNVHRERSTIRPATAGRRLRREEGTPDPLHAGAGGADPAATVERPIAAHHPPRRRHAGPQHGPGVGRHQPRRFRGALSARPRSRPRHGRSPDALHGGDRRADPARTVAWPFAWRHLPRQRHAEPRHGAAMGDPGPRRFRGALPARPQRRPGPDRPPRHALHAGARRADPGRIIGRPRAEGNLPEPRHAGPQHGAPVGDRGSRRLCGTLPPRPRIRL